MKLKALSIELDNKSITFDVIRQITDDFLAKNPKEAKKWWDVMAVVRGPDIGLNGGPLAKCDGSEPTAEKERIARKRMTCTILRGLFFPSTVNCSSAEVSVDPEALITLPPKEKWDHYDKHVWKVCQAHNIPFQIIGQEGQQPPKQTQPKGKSGSKPVYANMPAMPLLGTLEQPIYYEKKPPSAAWSFSVEVIGGTLEVLPKQSLTVMGKQGDAVVLQDPATLNTLIVLPHGAPLALGDTWSVTGYDPGSNALALTPATVHSTPKAPDTADGFIGWSTPSKFLFANGLLTAEHPLTQEKESTHAEGAMGDQK